ncbi:hypothetical protein PINS_up015035 [Pythium insidiosum]|nr:hypothetical protein PINS_up015035 [Pythium insidiosum]
MFLNGEMPPHIWSRIDAAYDEIYDEKTRARYDIWGPGTKKMTLLETQCNVALFYILWAMIIYSLTCSKATARASKWAYCALLGVFGLELAVRLLQYDPLKERGLLPFVTPHDLLVWAHRLLPIAVFTIVSIKRVFYVDMDLHHQRMLHHMLEKNKDIMSSLHAMAAKIQADQEATDKDIDVSKSLNNN